MTTINKSNVGFPALQIQALDGTFASLTADQTISGTNIFSGPVTFSSTITLSGSIVISGTVSFSGTANFSGVVNFSNNTNFTGTNVFTSAQINTLGVGTSGTVGALDIYPTTASRGKTRFTSSDNTGNTTTTVNVAAQATTRTYTLPDSGANASFIMSEGAQTVNGVKTYSANNIHQGSDTFLGTIKSGQSGTAGQIDIYPATVTTGKTSITSSSNSGDTTTSINVASQTGARTYTVIDAGASASFVMTEAAQTINGVKTLTGSNIHSGSTNTFTGTVKFGQSGTAGNVELYPGTSSTGKTTLTMTDNVGNTTTNINIGSQAGARTYTVPDAGASASFVMTEGAQTVNGTKTFSGGNTHSGNNTFSGTNTFSGGNTHSGANTFSGNNLFSGANTFNNTNTFQSVTKFGESGIAGNIELYPSTGSKGKTSFTMSDNSGNTTTNINVAAQSGARTYTVPDAGASASYVMTEGNQTINGVKTFATPIPVAGGGSGLSVANPFSCTGRLTLSSGTPITTSDVTAATTVYFTPYKGNFIALYTSSAWKLYTFSELSIAVPAAADTAYDVFAYDSGGNVTLEAVAWTNTTTRATGITLQNGVYCKSGSLDRRYLGSFVTTGVSGQTEDSTTNRYLYNYANRARKNLFKKETTGSWSVTSGTTLQSLNLNTSNRVNLFIGVIEDSIEVFCSASASNASGGGAGVGIGQSSTSANCAQVVSFNNGSTVSGVYAKFEGYPTIGFQYYQALQFGSNPSTFYSDASITNPAAGINASVLM